jgi:metal-responsive CopG/Arc/MetJ family transcriptional regulator
MTKGAGIMEPTKAVEDGITSYEEKIESVNVAFDEAGLIFGEFHESVTDIREERERIKAALRDTLAKNESLRRKDFDAMMGIVLSSQEQREREVKAMLAGYLAQQKEMAGKLREHLNSFRNSLVTGEAERLQRFQTLIREILGEQETRKAEITERLKAFQKEQSVLAVTFRELLSKGRELRIKDLKSTLRQFGAEQRHRLRDRHERRSEVLRMLDTFKMERREGPAQPQPAP